MRRFARLARLAMMKPTSLLRTIFVLLGILAVFLLGGCRKPSTSFYQDSTPPEQQTTSTDQHDSAPSPSPEETAAAEKHDAIDTVTDYLAALKIEKYQTAYDLLSRKSKKVHSISDFEQFGKQGMPSFDLKSATATIDGDHAVVTIQQRDDPATHDFNLVREEQEWKVVYQGGVPGMPYAE